MSRQSWMVRVITGKSLSPGTDFLDGTGADRFAENPKKFIATDWMRLSACLFARCGRFSRNSTGRSAVLEDLQQQPERRQDEGRAEGEGYDEETERGFRGGCGGEGDIGINEKWMLC